MTNLKEQRIFMKLGETMSETHGMPETAFSDNTMRDRERDISLRIHERRSTKYHLGDRWHVKSFRNIPANSGYRQIHLLTAIGLTPGGSSTVHIYTQTILRTTQLIWEERRPCPVFASYTLAFALQMRKKHGKISVRVAEECHMAR
jgi:hypothetical protein